MIGVLKEELRESHSGGAEEGMIRASLRGLKGSAAEQGNVRSLLLLFALVPEDTHCPLEVLLLMFNAVHEGAGTTMMHLRKWLRILLNRCLVLGTIDRPSLHDLVLDFAVAQHSSSDLSEQHRRVVEAFRAARPTDAYDRRKFDLALTEDPQNMYVCNNVMHHVSTAMQQSELVTPVDWLQDLPSDEIVYVTARELGVDKVEKLATRAEEQGDWWLAARYWSVVREVTYQRSGAGDAIEAALRSQGAIARMTDNPDPDATDDLRLTQASTVVAAFNVPVIVEHLTEYEELMCSGAGLRDPARVIQFRWLFGLLYPVLDDWSDDMEREALNLLEIYSLAREAARSDPDATVRLLCVQLSCSIPQVLDLTLAAKSRPFDWEEMYGEKGEYLIRCLRSYDWDAHHVALLHRVNGDWMHTAGGWRALMLRWGDVRTSKELIDSSLAVCRRAVDQEDGLALALEHASNTFGLIMYASLMFSLEMTYGQDKLVDVMTDAGLSYAEADTTLDNILTSWVRPRDDDTKDVHYCSADSGAEMAKQLHFLLSSKSHEKHSAEEVLSNLPSIKAIIRAAMTYTKLSPVHAQGIWNGFYGAAAVCERLGSYDLALQYCDAAMSPDLSQAGSKLPISRIWSQCIRGRCLVALGRSAEAAAVFESAAEEAHRYGVWLVEAYALRDLKLCVLDKMGHGEHGSRRLGAALRLLTGPADELTPLMKGLDAAALMALGPPEAGYEVVYEQEVPAATPPPAAAPVAAAPVALAPAPAAAPAPTPARRRGGPANRAGGGGRGGRVNIPTAFQ
jgi:hypothetical protein